MSTQEFDYPDLSAFTKKGHLARQFVKGVIDSLGSFEQTSFIKSLSSTMSSGSDIDDTDKDIATIIHYLMRGKDLKNAAVRETIKKQLLTWIFSPQSELCKLLKRNDSIQELHRAAKEDPVFFKFVSELITSNDPIKQNLLKTIQRAYKYSTKEACNRAKHGDAYELKQAHFFGINLNDTAEGFGAGGMETHLGPMTPLTVAAGNGYPNCVSFLLETAKVNVNGYAGRAQDYTALDCVNRWGKNDNATNTIAELLKKHGGFSARIYPVCNAAYLGNLDMFKKSLQEAKKKKISLNLPGRLPIQITFQSLLTLGRSSDSYNYKHLEIITPLALAVSCGHVDLVKELLKDPTVDVNAKSGKEHNYSPYDCAISFCPEEKRNDIILILENRNGQKYSQTSVGSGLTFDS